MKTGLQEVLNFWFEEIDSRMWFAKDRDFDELIRDRFFEVHHQAKACETFFWRKSPEGRLAEIIVLDQFSRNIYRNDARSFENDPLALALAQETVQCGDDQKLSPISKAFIYMPYMHSESQRIHEEAVRLFSQPGLEGSLEYELLHKDIIDRFGRYPYRNEYLGRPSSKEELEFLKLPSSTF